MATYTSETVTTTTRRYLLPLPSNAAELGKVDTAMFAQWQIDSPGQEMSDDAITVTAEDDMLVFSWAIPTPAAKPGAIVCACGHAKSEHTSLGCMVRDLDRGEDFCPCMVRSEQL